MDLLQEVYELQIYTDVRITNSLDCFWDAILASVTNDAAAIEAKAFKKIKITI